MKKMIESINHHWKNTYVSVEDKDGEKARGIFEHLEWYIQPDYYTKDNNNIKEIDWEQRRYEIAKDVLSALVSDPIADCEIPSEAVYYADALIKELKK